MITSIIVLIGAYLVGAIPTGYILCRRLFGIDITEHGSGNIGATNVARVLGSHFFFVVFLIDAAKAFLYLFLLLQFYVLNNSVIFFCAAIMLLVGNAYSVFLNFSGGKGVATMCGIIYALFPPLCFTWFALSWLLLVGITRKAFLGSIGAAISLVIVYVFLQGSLFTYEFYFLCWLCVWIIWRHKSNIERELA